MRTPIFLSFCLCLLALTGCSTGRSYHSFDSFWSLGYNDTRIAEDMWNVSYRGYDISQSEAHDYALLRAAEVTSAAGYRFFTVDGEQGSVSTGTIGTVNMYQGTGSGVVTSQSYPEVRLTIKGHRQKPAGNSLDTQYLLPALRKKYDL